MFSTVLLSPVLPNYQWARARKHEDCCPGKGLTTSTHKALSRPRKVSQLRQKAPPPGFNLERQCYRNNMMGSDSMCFLTHGMGSGINYSLWGSNPRPMAHKTIALTTELRELTMVHHHPRMALQHHSCVIFKTLRCPSRNMGRICEGIRTLRKNTEKRIARWVKDQ